MPRTAKNNGCSPAPGTTPRSATSPSRSTSKTEWLPHKHLEASTRAAYLSYLNKHFYPFFGNRPLNRISPSLVQDWVAKAIADGLSPRSIRKYHVLLSSIFGRAVKDRVLVHNPCHHTELPKVITRRSRTLTPLEYERLLAALPERHRLMVATLIEAGLRWGELVALKPRHIDFLRRTLTIEETIVEFSKKDSPTGHRYLVKPYPKDNEPRTIGVRQAWLDALAAHIDTHQTSDATTCSSPPRSAPPSPATPSAPASGNPPSKPPASASTSASTTSATPTPPGSSPAAPTSSPSWTAWATPKSKPPRNTSTPSPTPTNATSTPSPASKNSTSVTPPRLTRPGPTFRALKASTSDWSNARLLYARHS